jgi:hypothetical protein
MLLFEAASKLFNCVAVDLLKAAVTPAPVGVERLITILLRNTKFAEVAVALEVWKIPDVEKAAPVDVAFK